jgi:hypothetical protein
MLINYQADPTFKPLEARGFPTRQQAFIWRNWGLVPLERLARVLRTNIDPIVHMAESMGLEVPPVVSDLWLTRGYITIIRANWHLLNHDQMLELLDWDSSRLAFTLKEDDYLWVKLGQRKPDVPPLSYHPLTAEERSRTKELRDYVVNNFTPISRDNVQPFEFLKPYLDDDDKPEMITNWSYQHARADEVVLDDRWTIDHSEHLMRTKKFVDRFRAHHLQRWGKSINSSHNADVNPMIRLEVQGNPQLLSESHCITVEDRLIVITAVDEVGLLRGLQYLEQQMELRGAPFLRKEKLDRKTRFDTRIIYSYFAVYGDPLLDEQLNPYPNRLLERLSKAGINGIWLQGILYKLIPWELAPDLSIHWEKRIIALRSLADRAADYGIKIYLYFNEPRAMSLTFFEDKPHLKGHSDELYTAGKTVALCTSQDEVKDYLKNGTARLFAEVPELAGIITITMSEGLTNCYSNAIHGETNCSLCAERTPQDVVAEVNRLLFEGARSSKPDARLICWTWIWSDTFGWTPDMIDEAIRLMPSDIDLMCTSEEEKPTLIAGIPGKVIDYSLSVVGPSPKSLRSWKTAEDQGMRSMAKIQVNNTWECSAVPYLPVLDLAVEHVQKLKQTPARGLMLSWTLGGYPSLTLDRICSFYWETDGEIADSGNRYLSRFGYAELTIQRALTVFSEALKEFPFDVGVLYYAPQNTGPANLLHLHPSGLRATMVGFPYDDLTAWRSIYPADVLENQFEKLSTGWDRGIKLLKEADSLIDASRRSEYAELINVSLGSYYHFRSTYLQVAFVRLRDRFWEEINPMAKREFGIKMTEIAMEEQQLAKKLYDLILKDSLIGYEATNHYYYTAQDLREKAWNCQQIVQELAIYTQMEE